MTTSLLKVTGAVLAIAAGATAAFAAGGDRGMRGPVEFSTLDVDGSGEIEASDLLALRTQRITDMDTDGSGTISEAEFMASIGERAGERAGTIFERVDEDGDGAVAIEDMTNRDGRRGGGSKMIERADADGSGGVSEAEFEAFKEKMAERRDGKRGGKNKN